MKSASRCYVMALVFMIGGASSDAGATIRVSDLDFESGIVGPRGRFISYELFRPPGYQDAGKLPLVVHLHGFNEGLPNNLGRRYSIFEDLAFATQHQNFERYDYSPACGDCSRPTPDEQRLLEQARDQNEEYSAYLLTPFLQNGGGWTSDRLVVAREAIQYALDNYAVDTDRIYLSGFSSGGFGVVSMLATYPDVFAAGVSLAGGGSPSDALVDSLVDQPLWLFHGTADAAVSASASTGLHDALVLAGGDPRLTLIPGGTHDSSWQTAYADRSETFYPWLFTQSRAVPEPRATALVSAAWLTITTRRRRTNASAKAAKPIDVQ